MFGEGRCVKKYKILFVLPSFIRNIATKVANLLPLGNAKKKFSLFSFALPSFIRNFALK